MRKFSLLLIFVFTFFFTIAQVIYYDKEIKVNQTRLPKGTMFVDRWGYPFLINTPTQNFQSSVFSIISCGSFNLTFGDLDNNTGRGFDDQTFINLPVGHPLGVSTIRLGELRRWTACQVFTYISQVILIPTNTSPPDIYFDISQNTGLGALGFATPSFSTSSPNNSFLGGLLQQHITTGIDPTPNTGNYDAKLTFDFGVNNTWPSNGQYIPINSDGNSTTANGIDLYSVILHEATHALGFFSNIQNNGNSSLTNTPTGKFSLLDRYLFSSNFPNSPNTNTGLSLINLTTFTFQSNISSLTSNVIKYFNVNTNSKSYSIFSPPIWQNGSSLSHFDNFREPYEEYMFTPSYSGGLVRVYSKAELTVFCNLGYNIIPTNTGFSCSDRYAVGVDDFATINLSENITRNVISNDYDFDGQPITLDIPSVTLLNNAGTVSSTGNNIIFTSNGTYSGEVNIRYRPYTIANGQKGSYAIYRINVISPDYCPLDPCNYVCNGGFENGLTIQQFDAIVNNPSFTFNTVKGGGIPGWLNLGNLNDNSLTSDCFFRGSQVFPFTSLYPAMGIPRNELAQNAPGVNTPNFPVNNDRYAGMGQGATAYNFASEGIYRQLVKPLESNTSYLLTYSARAIKITFAGAPTGNSPPSLNVSFSNSTPPTNGITYPYVFNGDNLTTSPIQFTSDTDPNNIWTNVSIPFTTGSTQVSNFIVFQPPFTQTPNYIFIDNIRLIKVGNPISITTTSSLINPKIGDNVTFSVNVCNTGTTTINDVNLTNILPQGLSLVSSTLNSYPNHNFATLLAGQCLNLTVTTNVNSDVSFNADLNNCANLTSASACAQTQSCATVKVLATDISVAASQSATCDKFKVTISNLGNVNANNVKLNYSPPNCFGYSSYSVLTGNASYSLNLITIPLILSGESVIIEFTGNIPTSSCINTVSLQGSYDEWDLNLSNNSASINLFQSCQNGNNVWPKSYPTQDGLLDLTNAYSNNIILSAAAIINQPSYFLNHLGFLPPLSQSHSYAYHFTNSGISNWDSELSLPTFALSNGVLQMNENFVNGTNGQIVSAPSILQNPFGKIIAEASNGDLISVYDNKLKVSTNFGSSLTDLNCVFYKSLFNKSTNNLFLFGDPTSHCLNIYHLNGASLSLIYSTTTLPIPISNISSLKVDNSDNIYIVYSNQINKFNYISNTFETVSILSLTNNDLHEISCSDPYTSDQLVIYKFSNEKLYLINLENMTSQYIQTSNCSINNYLINGNELYLTGYNNVQSFIGSHVIPQYQFNYGIPIFITKLNFNEDFSYKVNYNTSNLNFNSKLSTISKANNEKSFLNVSLSINLKNPSINYKYYISTIDIYNNLGQKIMILNNQSEINNLIQYNKSNNKISSGIYYLSLNYKNGNKEIIKRFVIN